MKSKMQLGDVESETRGQRPEMNQASHLGMGKSKRIRPQGRDRRGNHIVHIFILTSNVCNFPNTTILQFSFYSIVS